MINGRHKDQNKKEADRLVGIISEAINSIPKTYERLKDDLEWNTKRCTSITDILGLFVKYAVIQCGGFVPPEIYGVVGYLKKELIKREFTELTDEFRFQDLSLCDISKLLWDILGDFPLFTNWNDSTVMTGMDWIDLDALLHNVCIGIRADRRDFDRFNEEFELKQKEYKKLLNKANRCK